MNIFGYLVDFFPFLQNPTIFQLLKFMIKKKKKKIRQVHLSEKAFLIQL